MMIIGETVVTPSLPGDSNDALRKVYAAAKPAIMLRPAIDQTILNAARDNTRQSLPFYKKIPWYTQISMAGAVFGSLLLSAAVIYKTVVFKHDKGVEELITADAAVKTEEARKKAPMVVSILADSKPDFVPPPAVMVPAATAVTPTRMASADTVPDTRSGPAALAQAPASGGAAPAIVAALAPATPAAASKTERPSDQLVMADASASDRARRESLQAAAPAAAPMSGNAGSTSESSKKATVALTKETNMVPPVTAARAVAAAPPAAPAMAAAAPPAILTRQAWQTQIEALQKAGKTELAKTELQALLKRYPDTVLTPELKRLLTN